MRTGGLTALLLAALTGGAQALPVSPYLAAHVGSQWHDQQLADYRWEQGAHSSLGLEAGLEWQAWHLGVRVARSATEQGSGIPGDAQGPDLHITESSLVLGRRLISGLGFALQGQVAAGLLHLGYQPDSREYSLGGGSTVTVDYAPIDEWQFGVGLGIQRQLVGPVALGLLAEYQRFGLDTAHRVGTDIEEQRDRFGFWTARASLHFTFGAR